MSKKVYNKLVRSEIPEIIKSEGRACAYVELDSKEDKDHIIQLLKEKLIEEAQEVMEAKHKGQLIEELGDLHSVFCELRDMLGFGWSGEIGEVIKAKNIQKGEFRISKDKNGNIVSSSARCDSVSYIKLISVDDGQET